VAVLLPVLTSMFLHGSWMHVIGNMWFLWIFGDNIEDYLGHFKYLVFYLASGMGAAFAQVILNPHSRVPTVGASGAIAGVLGAYFVLYPRARVLIWFPIFFLFYLPAWVTLGYWFAMQFLSGAATSIADYSDTHGGVAFWAHVGGFVAGIVLIKILPERPRRYRYGTW
jgi:membrane associated rhomboid family serine protease